MTNRFLTFSPIKFPINTVSEARPKSENHSIIKHFQDAGKGIAGFHCEEVAWPFGYGTIMHDDIPVYFQPVCVIRLSEASDFQLAELAVTACEIYVYDDGIAVMKLGVDAPDDLEAESLVVLLNRITTDYFKVKVVSIIHTIWAASKLGKSRNLSSKSFFDFAGAEIIWTMRVAILENDGSASSPYAGALIGDRIETLDLYDALVRVSSGGSEIVLRDSDDLTALNEFERVMTCAQFYSAVMDKIQKNMLADIRMVRAKNLKRKQLFYERVDDRNEHTKFIALQWARVIYGTQGRRRLILNQIETSWGTADYASNLFAWSAYLQNKIVKYNMQRQRYFNKFLRVALFSLAGISLIDITVTLWEAAQRVTPENFPSLLTLFVDQPLGVALNLSLLVLCVLMLVSLRSGE